MLKKALLAVFLASGLAGTAAAESPELTYVNSACSITQSEFNTWFVSGSMSQNGLVTFANSVGFPTNNTDCDFYKWAYQMFLWIASPIGKGTVLETPTFYTVNFNSQGQAVYIANAAPGTAAAQHPHPLKFALRSMESTSRNIQPGGQAGGSDTLLSLNNSLIYFTEDANDMYAWLNTAVSNNAPGFPFATTPFPTTTSQMSQIVTYANSKGAQIGDAAALTLELKTAWVDAATVANPQDYITTTAIVPNYVGAIGGNVWTVSGEVTKKLALVGIHIVGSVQGHPEMVWATIEHRDNAPDNQFFVQLAPELPPIEIPYNSAGIWALMSNGGSQAGANESQMCVVNGSSCKSTRNPPPPAGSIVALTSSGIQHNNVYRYNPFGNAPTPASVTNNSQLISLNLDILAMLNQVNDLRRNYFMEGAVWTRNGSIPTSKTDTTNQVGSLQLANTTMETYHQNDGTNGCFGCHNTGGASSFAPTVTSHLFSPTNVPLAQ